MSERSERPEHGEARDSTSRAAMPSCCGPTAERMFKAFCESVEDSKIGSSTEKGESDATTSCASAMRWMASACCSPPPKEETDSDAEAVS